MWCGCGYGETTAKDSRVVISCYVQEILMQTQSICVDDAKRHTVEAMACYGGICIQMSKEMGTYVYCNIATMKG